MLADCITHAIDLGAERLVDIATLTGGIVTALGTAFAGLMGNDDDWAAAVLDAGAASGERVWRLPLRPAVRRRDQGPVRRPRQRDARPQRPPDHRGAEFLARFAGDVPWAHVDMAGVSNDTGRAYAAKGGSGFGVRLLVELVRARSPATSAQPMRVRPVRRPPADPARPCATSRAQEVAPVAEELDREKRFPYEIVRQARRARADGDPVPRGVRRRGRRLRSPTRWPSRSSRGSDSSRGHHDVRAHVAGHAADLPVRHRGAEGAAAARPVRRAPAGRVRADRARGRQRRRQHEDARRAATTASG